MKLPRIPTKVLLSVLIVLLLACLVAPVFAASAEPQIEWQQQFKGMKFYTVIQAWDGGYLLTGTNTSATWADVVMKTDASGNVEWTRTYYIGTYYPIFTRAIQTSDGWYVLAGERNVEGYPSTAPYVNATELCVGKIDPSGTMQWSMTYIHEDGAIANDLVGFIETPDSSFLLVCNWYTFEPTDVWAWLVKTDWSGNLRWTRVMQGQYSGFNVGSMLLTNDNLTAFIGTTANEGSQSGMQLIKTDSGGVKLWQETYHFQASVPNGTQDQSGAYAGIETADDGFLLAGYGGTPYNSWLVKTDSEGVMQWNRTYSDFNSLHSVVQNGHGGFAFTAMKDGNTWVAQTDEAGDVAWSWKLPSTDGFSSVIQKIVNTADGGYAVLGVEGKDSLCNSVLVKINSASAIPELPSALPVVVLMAATAATLVVVRKRRMGKL